MRFHLGVDAVGMEVAEFVGAGRSHHPLRDHAGLSRSEESVLSHHWPLAIGAHPGP